MAVTFNPIGGAQLTIGGTSGTGPFPKYSINTERVESGDGTLIDLIYNNCKKNHLTPTLSHL